MKMLRKLFNLLDKGPTMPPPQGIYLISRLDMPMRPPGLYDGAIAFNGDESGFLKAGDFPLFPFSFFRKEDQIEIEVDLKKSNLGKGTVLENLTIEFKFVPSVLISWESRKSTIPVLMHPVQPVPAGADYTELETLFRVYLKEHSRPVKNGIAESEGKS